MVKKYIQLHNFSGDDAPFVVSGNVYFSDGYQYDMFADNNINIGNNTPTTPLQILGTNGPLLTVEHNNTVVLGNSDHNITIDEHGIMFNGNVDPTIGQVKYNLDLDCMMYYDGFMWVNVD